MRYLLPLLILLCMPCSIYAQVTLNQGDYPATLSETDTLKRTTAASAFPSLSLTASGVWDMSTITDSTPILLNYRVFSLPYDYDDSTTTFRFVGYPYQGNIKSLVSSTSISEQGVFTYDTSYDIVALTISVGDSLFFPAQNITYSSGRKKVVFPAGYGSSWSSNYVSDFNFGLNYAFYSYHHTPGIVRSYVAESDSVTGWGKMRVPDIAGSPSPYWDVVQISSRIIRRDSFMLNDSAMPGAVLTGFGLYQGRPDTTYEQNYYRKGEYTPLASVAFRDAAFTQPYKAITHAQRLARLSVLNEQVQGDIRAYPNPLSGNSLTIIAPKASTLICYKLFNLSGVVVTEGQANLHDASGQINLPHNLSSGVYLLQITEDGNAISALGIQVNR